MAAMLGKPLMGGLTTVMGAVRKGAAATPAAVAAAPVLAALSMTNVTANPAYLPAAGSIGSRGHEDPLRPGVFWHLLRGAGNGPFDLVRMTITDYGSSTAMTHNASYQGVGFYAYQNIDPENCGFIADNKFLVVSLDANSGSYPEQAYTIYAMVFTINADGTATAGPLRALSVTSAVNSSKRRVLFDDGKLLITGSVSGAYTTGALDVYTFDGIDNFANRFAYSKQFVTGDNSYFTSMYVFKIGERKYRIIGSKSGPSYCDIALSADGSGGAWDASGTAVNLVGFYSGIACAVDDAVLSLRSDWLMSNTPLYFATLGALKHDRTVLADGYSEIEESQFLSPGWARFPGVLADGKTFAVLSTGYYKRPGSSTSEYQVFPGSLKIYLFRLVGQRVGCVGIIPIQNNEYNIGYNAKMSGPSGNIPDIRWFALSRDRKRILSYHQAYNNTGGVIGSYLSQLVFE